MPHVRHRRNNADLPVAPLLLGESKQQWIYRQFASAIEAQLLKPGDAVPSTRALAQRWKVSRGVAELAFEQLRAEGYLDAAAGRGTTVATNLPDRFLRAAMNDAGGVVPQAPHAPPLSDPALAAIGVQSAHPGRAFVARLPDVGMFDLGAWQRCIVRAAKRLDQDSLGRFDPQGLPQLRAAICDHLALTRGIRCDADEVVVVTGIRHAIDLCAQAAVPLGGAIALEDPGYAGAESIFRLRGFRSVPIEVDGEGLIVRQLDSHPDLAMAYVTPAHQAPMGVTLSPGRRTDLLAWATRSKAWILEDDYDSDFSYEAAPLAALKSMDAPDRVIFCGSFNKATFPGLRIGYLVAPKALVGKLVSARAITGRSNPVLDQLALVEFMASGALLRHLKKTRLAYKERRDTVMAELRKVLGSAVSFQGTHAGLHFVLHLPARLNEADAIAAAAKAGIAVQGLAAFSRAKTRRSNPALVIGYTALSTTQAKWSARRLGEALERLVR